MKKAPKKTPSQPIELDEDVIADLDLDSAAASAEVKGGGHSHQGKGEVRGTLTC